MERLLSVVDGGEQQCQGAVCGCMLACMCVCVCVCVWGGGVYVCVRE